jgi:Tfp pilus tip-associated adhesin PilY1
MMAGSGRLPYAAEQQAQRGGGRSGTRLYMVDVATGTLLDASDVGSDGAGEDEAAAGTGLKNALQADPLAVRDEATGAVTAVYAGDTDGRLWRFGLSAADTPTFAGMPRLLFDGGRDQPVFGSMARLAGSAGQAYLFLGTGSDLLPRFGTPAAYRLVGLAETAGGVRRQFERVLRTAGSGGVDEAVAGAPVVGGGVVFFATTARERGGCGPSEASLYALTISGGVAYDTNGDGRRDSRDSAVISRQSAVRSGAPVLADRHLFVATGDRVQLFGDPDRFAATPAPSGLRLISWREVR